MTVTSSAPFRKPAEADHPIHDLIRERWSPRAFAARPVEQIKLHSIFEAARWAASSNNRQPWNFIIATTDDPEDHAHIAAILNEKNRAWAQHAPVLILVVAQLYSQPGKEQASLYDVGMAVGNLVTQAVDLGLVTHQMGGFNADQARETLGIPEGFVPIAVIALGYPGAPAVLPEELQAREAAPRTRKPLEEFVFVGQWEQVAAEVGA